MTRALFLVFDLWVIKASDNETSQVKDSFKAYLYIIYIQWSSIIMTDILESFLCRRDFSLCLHSDRLFVCQQY